MTSDDFPIRDGQTVVFIGDSITDCGRRDEFAPLGCGYVSMVIGQVVARFPERQVTWVNRGIGGDVVTGLRDRWSEDVVAHRPDWLSVKIGINDLHRTMRGTNPVPVDVFGEAYGQILDRAVNETPVKSIVLMDPFYMATPQTASADEAKVLEMLPAYQAVVAEMASRFGAIHVRTHDVFQRVLAHHPRELICNEPVHPNHAGHAMIARAWLEAVGG